jgi:hypothetical protein
MVDFTIELNFNPIGIETPPSPFVRHSITTVITSNLWKSTHMPTVRGRIYGKHVTAFNAKARRFRCKIVKIKKYISGC